MKLEDLVKNHQYTMEDKTVYAYGLEEYHIPYVLNKYNTNYDYIRNVVFQEKLKPARFINGSWFNIKVSIAKDVIIYTNSYFLSEGNKQQTSEDECANISEYIDQRLDEINKRIVEKYGGYFVYNNDSSEEEYDDLHCVEIKNGKPIFNKSEEYEKRLKQRFQNAISREKQVHGYKFKENWDKEIIHMQIDKAIDDGNQEEFIRLSEKLKEMGL